jgi:hypothetical protein
VPSLAESSGCSCFCVCAHCARLNQFVCFSGASRADGKVTSPTDKAVVNILYTVVMKELIAPGIRRYWEYFHILEHQSLIRNTSKSRRTDQIESWLARLA